MSIKGLPSIQEIEGLYAQGAYMEALSYAQDLIKIDNKNIQAFDLAATCALALKDRELAKSLWNSILGIKSDYVPAYIKLGQLSIEMNNVAGAESYYCQALSYVPSSVEVQNNYANFLQQQGRIDEAESYYRRSLELRPDLPNLYSNYGIFLKTQSRFHEAESVYLKAIEINPRFVDAHSNLGNMYFKVERYIEAEICYKMAIKLNPRNSNTYNSLGQLYFDIKKYPEAEDCYRTAIALNPGYTEAHFNYGNLLYKKWRPQEAEIEYRQALVCKHDYVDALINLGIILYDWDKIEEAKELFLKVLQFQPNCVDAYHNLGLYYIKRRKWDLAEEHFRHALSINEDNPRTLFNLGYLFLLMGRYEEGWPLYQYRCDPRMDELAVLAPNFSFPVWKGENLSGKKILVMHEQGFGDVIQFARYIPVLKKRGAAHITLICQKPLKPLLLGLKDVDLVLCSNEEDKPKIGAHDCWTFLVSIPYYVKTNIKTIPTSAGCFTVPRERLEKWCVRLPSKGLKVGLVWKGSLTRMNDHRSLSDLAQLKSLWSIPGISYVSLQKEKNEDDLPILPKEQPLYHLGTDIKDFADSAAILKQLDLLICVDTAIAHLAGALGMPVWVMLPFTADWRWFVDRKDNPWYPSMRLFQQREQGDWSHVIDLVTQNLQKLVEKKPRKSKPPKT